LLLLQGTIWRHHRVSPRRGEPDHFGTHLAATQSPPIFFAIRLDGAPDHDAEAPGDAKLVRSDAAIAARRAACIAE
jgi:hypothetical protein